jgi:hypothetical protein
LAAAVAAVIGTVPAPARVVDIASAHCFPYEYTFFAAVSDAVVWTAAREQDLIGQVGVKGHIVDLAHNFGQLGNVECNAELMIKTTRHLDLKALRRTFDDLERVPARWTGFVDLYFYVAQIIKISFLFGCPISEVPLRDAGREDDNTHDLKGPLLADLRL